MSKKLVEKNRERVKKAQTRTNTVLLTTRAMLAQTTGKW